VVAQALLPAPGYSRAAELYRDLDGSMLLPSLRAIQQAITAVLATIVLKSANEKSKYH